MANFSEAYLDKIKTYLESNNLDYYDFRIEKSKKTGIFIDNDKVRTIAENKMAGIGIRIYKNKKLGFCTTTNLNNYKQIIDDCIRATERSTKKIELKNFTENTDKIRFKHKSFDDIELDKKVKDLLKINKDLLNNKVDYKILNSEITCREEHTDKYFINPWSDIYQETAYNINYSRIVGQKNSIIEKNLSRNCKMGGFESVTLDDKIKMLSDNKEILQEILNSKPCPATKADAILDQDVVGLMAHEAIGHPCEADSLELNSTVLNKRGIKLTDNTDVTIVDDPTIKGFGYFVYDDEGTKAKKTILIKNGIVNDYMTDIQSATYLEERSNGSGRADGFSSMPIVRMSNTFFLPGKDKNKDMLSNFSGYYLKGFAGGQVNPAIGTFMFGIKQAYLYKNGEIVGKFKQASISGNILKYLKGISKISYKNIVDGAGFCGKGGQTAYVGDGGPKIRINNITIGGTKHE